MVQRSCNFVFMTRLIRIIRIFLRTQLERWNLRRELFHSLTFFFFSPFFLLTCFKIYWNIRSLSCSLLLSKVILFESWRNHNQILLIERSWWNTYICILNVLRAFLHLQTSCECRKLCDPLLMQCTRVISNDLLYYADFLIQMPASRLNEPLHLPESIVVTFPYFVLNETTREKRTIIAQPSFRS